MVENGLFQPNAWNLSANFIHIPEEIYDEAIEHKNINALVEFVNGMPVKILAIG